MNVQQELYYTIGQILRMKSANQSIDVSDIIYNHMEDIHEKDLEIIVTKINDLIAYIDHV